MNRSPDAKSRTKTRITQDTAADLEYPRQRLLSVCIRPDANSYAQYDLEQAIQSFEIGSQSGTQKIDPLEYATPYAIRDCQLL